MPATYQDYYATLGVGRTATDKEIKAAFRKLARANHPDVKPNDPAAEARFKAASEAYEVLSDPEKRRRYDELGPQWEQMGQMRGARGGHPDVEYHSVSPEELEDLFGDRTPFSDFFNQMFGGSGRPRGRHQRTAPPLQGANVEAVAEISLEDAYRGTTATVEMAGGRRPRRVEVTIPPGITNSGTVRARGQGGPGSGSGPSGDLLVTVRIRPHPQFQREGTTLTTTVPVPLRTALLGGSVRVPTLRGTAVELTVPPGTQNGTKLRLRGLGMPNIKGGPPGDLIALVEIRLPEVTPDIRTWAESMPSDAE